MSEEMFEKQFKDGLQSHKTRVSPKVWQNVQSGLPLPWYTPLMQNIGWKIYSLITSVAILGMMYQTKQLWDKVERMETNYGQVTLTKETVVKTISRVDTLVINKTIYINQIVPENRFSPKDIQQVATSSYSISDKKIIKNLNPILEKEKKMVSEEDLNFKTSIVKDSDLNTKTNNEKQANNQTRSLSQNTKSLIKVDSSSENTSSVLNNKRNQKEIEIKEIIDSLKNYIDNNVTITPKTTKIKWKPNIQSRIGLNNEFSLPNNYSFGSTVEVFLQKDISLSLGLNARFCPKVIMIVLQNITL